MLKKLFQYWVGLAAALLLVGAGCFLLFSTASFLDSIFLLNTSRELLRGAYATTFIVTGIGLVLAIIFNLLFHRDWRDLISSTAIRFGVLFTAFAWVRTIYLMQAWSLSGTLGFPIDDSWIHLVYARNLGEGLAFGFNPGVLDCGSSSPLWCYILSLGSRLGANPVWNAYLWSCLSWSLAIVATYLLVKRITEDGVWGWIAAFILAVNPMAAWSSLAGLETGMFATLMLWAVYLRSYKPRGLWAGAVLAGLSGLMRLEGIFFIMALLMVDLVQNRSRDWKGALGRLLLSLVIMMPWILHNLVLNGQWLPQTFYAKAHPLSWSLWWGTVEMTGITLVTPGLVFLSLCVPMAIWGWLKQRHDHGFMLPLLIALLLIWGAFSVSIGHFGQYQRYVHPLLPIFLIFIVTGIYKALSNNAITRRFIGTGLMITTAVAGISSADNYGWGVQNISAQQINMAHWVAKYVPEGETIAANDVGALGYYSRHVILDLCGLVGNGAKSMRPGATWQDLLEKGISWAVIYPDSFPELSGSLQVWQMAEFAVERTVTLGGEKAIVLYKPIPVTSTPTPTATEQE